MEKTMVLFWVCGWGLAENSWDNFRHLSSKSMMSWKIERWMIYSVNLYFHL
jgi:hypothetical protein